MYSYALSYFVVPIFLCLITLYMLWCRKITFRRSLLSAALVCAAAFPVLLFIGTMVFGLPSMKFLGFTLSPTASSRLADISIANFRNNIIDILKYTGNTVALWLGGAIPQIIIALLLAIFFTSTRLKIKGQAFFKAVIYMPNLIMASAFSMLFFTLFSNVGPVNQLIVQMGWSDHVIDFFAMKFTVRGLICLMNFLMWFGNTTILLMAGIMGIDQSLFEAAVMDGAKSIQVFFRVTLPLLMPILIYTVITALIGGLQMFDVPQVLTNGLGTPNRSSTTLIMYLINYLGASKNYGMSGAISVIIFIITGALSLVVFKFLTKPQDG